MLPKNVIASKNIFSWLKSQFFIKDYVLMDHLLLKLNKAKLGKHTNFRDASQTTKTRLRVIYRIFCFVYIYDSNYFFRNGTIYCDFSIS